MKPLNFVPFMESDLVNTGFCVERFRNSVVAETYIGKEECCVFIDGKTSYICSEEGDFIREFETVENCKQFAGCCHQLFSHLKGTEELFLLGFSRFE
jgi:hypothetical protein